VATRRNPGEGGLHWEESRQRWFATVYVGYSPDGKRRKVKVSARTKTEAQAKLQLLLRDRDDGHVLGGQTYTVRDAVESWLAHGLTGRQESTVVNRTILARTHVIPALGARKLAQLSAEEVDEWLATKAKTLSTDTLHRLLLILRQSIRRAQARDLVKRNVALLCDVPRGTAGRPSKSLTLAQAADLLTAAQRHPTMHAYIVVSLLTGADRGVAGADLEPYGPRRRPAECAVVAIGARGRGHQDATVTAHSRAPEGLRSRASSAQTLADPESPAQRGTMARQ
jgi:hypothetical protein